MTTVHLARTLSFRDDPETAGETAVVYREKGAVVVGDDGRIRWAGEAADLPPAFAAAERLDYGTSLLMPGFVDAHLHFPQWRMQAAPGRDLLEWLERFTFREEARYADAAHAAAAAEIFFDRLLANGTTAAAVYSSSHAVAAEALFAAAERRGMAIATGKTLMDRGCPDSVRDDPHRGIAESAALIERWHGRGRLVYAVTPRFAVTSTETQLRMAGELLAAHPGCLMQTHLSESRREIETVRALFPWAKSYTDVYDRFGLLGPRSLFGHAIHLDLAERRRLAESGSVAVHCPTSNTFLGSGLFDLARFAGGEHPIRVALATDVGGGTSWSMLATMGRAIEVARLAGGGLTATRAFYLATLAGARALARDGEIGALEPGRVADLVLVDPRATAVLAARDDLSETLEDRLFALAILGDERAIAKTWIAGRAV
ncbi:guanine deaminase [Siculibacillus lacustris]|uniref:Guanine deaminase n=1 Tax=Siculibacillus lacustris TaxID=1549641 RepID=A0A4V2KTG9_9HYPH|nr:guanine deaminase [Siculibacillus lacustris]TBW37194.1 guanine deaminase [Siculibacillus lacustris]